MIFPFFYKLFLYLKNILFKVIFPSISIITYIVKLYGTFISAFVLSSLLFLIIKGFPGFLILKYGVDK